jgi:uncharacterized hydrophobic protein (TIGR00271 family)
MIRLEAFGSAETMAEVERLLERAEGASRVRAVATTRTGHWIVSATVRRSSVDPIVASIRRLGVSDDQLTLTHVEELRPSQQTGAQDSPVWEDVLGSTWLHARPVLRYATFMFVAGVVAFYGIIESSAILIVGAMAISPDMQPIMTIAVGAANRRPRLACRALLTVVLGLATTTAAATVFALIQRALHRLSAQFNIDTTVLGTLAHVSGRTVIIAFVAGVAGMLSLETRARAAVGVAISVTTIPAAAYLGVALGIGNTGRAGGALAVLATNVVMMVLGASAVLAAQEALERRHRGTREPTGSRSG